MMAETLFPLIAATIAFVGSHFLLSAQPVRAPLLARLGRWGFTVLYSAAAAGTFVWMCLAYARAPLIDLWATPDWLLWLAMAVNLAAAILVACGYLTPNPTALFGARVLGREDPAPGIFKVTRHPVMWGIALWSAMHLVATGDSASFVFFGALAALALAGAAHIDARRAREGDADWPRLVAATSFWPFAAALEGRARISLAGIGWVRIGIGALLFLLLLWGHEWIIGVIVAPWSIPALPPGL